MRIQRKYEGGKVAGVKVFHTGTSREQNFSRRLVEAALVEGWMTLSGDRLVMKASPEDLVYEVLRVPGTYCDICGKRLDAGGSTARLHVTSQHPNAATSPAWPAGYAVINAYECLLDEEQHERYKAVPFGVRKGD